MSSDVLAIIPARSGSKGIPNKNFRELAGVSPVERATLIAKLVADQVIISSDTPYALANWNSLVTWERLLHAPPPLHTDTCPMIDVVRDVLDRVPGPQDQIIVLLQPTQPLRQPYHIAAAILALEQNGGADSIVSVVELPATHAAGWQAWIAPDGALIQDWTQHPSCRQDLPKAYIRDGTVYAFRRGTVRRCGNIYGFTVRPLIIPQDETCPLDTLADWADAERRLRDRMGHG